MTVLLKSWQDYCSLGASGQLEINRWGIAFGQKGYASNQHFVTESQAVEAFEKMLTEVRATYARGFKAVVEDVTEFASNPAGTVKMVKFTGILKSGKPSKLVHTVAIYRINHTTEVEAAINAERERSMAFWAKQGLVK